MAKRGPKIAPTGHPHYEGGELEAISREHADFCSRRVGFLATFQEAHRPLLELLANAYWLGVQDAVEAYVAQGVVFSPKGATLTAERDWIRLEAVPGASAGHPGRLR